MKYTILIVASMLAVPVVAQQPNAQQRSILWSSKTCGADDCQSSIARPGTFTDGSGIFTEAMVGSGKRAVVVGMIASDSYFEVLLAFGVDDGGTPFKLNPLEAVTIEAGPMILYPVDPQTSAFKKSITSRAYKPQFKKEVIAVNRNEKIESGFVVRYFDREAELELYLRQSRN